MTNSDTPGNPRAGEQRAENAEAAFVATLAANYTPAPMSETDRRSFDRSLAARLAAPRRAWRSVPALAATAAAAAIAVFAAPALFLEDREPPSGETGGDAFAAVEWESQLLDASGFVDVDAFDEFDDLPADYAAIAGLLLDG